MQKHYVIFKIFVNIKLCYKSQHALFINSFLRKTV